MTHRQWPAYAGYGGAILTLHVSGIAALLAAGRAHPALAGMGFVAYTLGLRHAFDADHIAAIDNVVRKLLRERRSPLGVGFYFSIGHSTVVFLMAAATVLVTRWTARSLPQLQALGGLIGTTVSGGFLILIGVLNLFIWIDIYLIFRRMRGGSRAQSPPEPAAAEMEGLLLSRGLVMRLASPLLRLITGSRHAYPLGFLFGLGFDTASEIALLALAATAAASALPVWGVFALPLLFASGMSLGDTADGFFMATAYRWAFATPIRRVYYNLTVTGLSVAAALLIGGIELAQVLARTLGRTSGFWGRLQALDLGRLGYLLAALFVIAWSCSYGVWRLLKIENRPG